jgi:hypothetical protein
MSKCSPYSKITKLEVSLHGHSKGELCRLNQVLSMSIAEVKPYTTHVRGGTIRYNSEKYWATGTNIKYKHEKVKLHALVRIQVGSY